MSNIIEVAITDINEDDHIYWIEMPEGESDEDYAIERALAFHATTDRPSVIRTPEEEDPEDFTQIPCALAYEPFDLEEGEYTLVKLEA